MRLKNITTRGYSCNKIYNKLIHQEEKNGIYWIANISIDTSKGINEIRFNIKPTKCYVYIDNYFSIKTTNTNVNAFLSSVPLNYFFDNKKDAIQYYNDLLFNIIECSLKHEKNNIYELLYNEFINTDYISEKLIRGE